MNPYQPGEDNQDPYEVGYKAGAASLAEQIASLKDELRQISTAIDDVRLDLTNTAAELIMEMKERLASRDAEVVSLTNQRDYEYVRAENAEQERDQFEQVRDQLRAQINVLREAATPFTSPDVVDETSGTIPLMDALEKAISSTPEQSLAEYRNKVIEECAAVLNVAITRLSSCGASIKNDVAISTLKEQSCRLRAMKEQP